MKRIIHFYSSYNLIPDDIITKVITDYDTTEAEIYNMNNGQNVIHTTSMANLSSYLFLEHHGHFDEIWIHDKDGEPFNIKCVERLDNYTCILDCDATPKELRISHNLLKLWIAGEFSNRSNLKQSGVKHEINIIYI